MRYSFRLSELLGHVPDPKKRPGTIKAIVEHTGLDRHQVAALLKNEVKYIPLKALSRLCDYLIEQGHATADQLPGALFAVEPENSRSEPTSSPEASQEPLPGDALVAEFQRASDAVTAALAFQAANAAHNERLAGDIKPVLRVGIALGEVIIADDTLTGAGVVLAQRLELEPALCVSSLRRGFSTMHNAMLAPLIDGIRAAGLQE